MFSVSGTLELPQTLKRNIPSTYSIVHILIVSDFPDCQIWSRYSNMQNIFFHNQPLLNNYMYIYFTEDPLYKVGRAIIRIHVWVINRIMTVYLSGLGYRRGAFQLIWGYQIPVSTFAAQKSLKNPSSRSESGFYKNLKSTNKLEFNYSTL